MGYTTCPQCARRLHVPDSDAPLALRCPSCKHTFKTNGDSPAVGAEADSAPDSPASAPSPGRGGASAATVDAPAKAPRKDDAPFDFGTLDSHRRILSAADEAMLRDLGSGSGLLELTREAFEVQAGQRARSSLSPQEEPEGELSDRQFQIVGTALTMANKLVIVYKEELARTRRLSLAAWVAVAAVAAVSVAVFWWGMGKSGSADVEKNNVTNLTQQKSDADSRLKDELARQAKLSTELEAARADIRKTQDELAGARATLETARGDAQKAQSDLAASRQELIQSKATAQVLSANLETANARASGLEAQMALLQATSRPTSMPSGITAASTGK